MLIRFQLKFYLFMLFTKRCVFDAFQVREGCNYIPKFYGDRFIPRRYSGFRDINSDVIRAKCIHQDVLRMVRTLT